MDGVFARPALRFLTTMTDPKPFQIARASVPSPGESVPLTVAIRLTFAPSLLEAVAAYSRRNQQSLEEAIIAVLRERFPDAAE